MQFRSERDQQLAAAVIRQMLSLVESLLQRIAPIQREAELRDTEVGRLLLDAVCMQYLALGAFVKQLDKLTDHTLQDQCPDQAWKGIMSFRDLLAHQYFNVDPRQALWITREAFPQLQTRLEDMMASLERCEDC
jgi:uncharacterized protein with HEPN domain